MLQTRRNKMITKTMLIGEIININPELISVLMESGMHCVGCPASAGETLEEACEVHGIDVDELIEVLNTVNDSKPAYETTIIENDIKKEE